MSLQIRRFHEELVRLLLAPLSRLRLWLPNPSKPDFDGLSEEECRYLETHYFDLIESRADGARMFQLELLTDDEAPQESVTLLRRSDWGAAWYRSAMRDPVDAERRFVKPSLTLGNRDVGIIGVNRIGLQCGVRVFAGDPVRFHT